MSVDNTISLSEWLTVIEGEYLRDYVRAGGAAVKFAITPDSTVTKCLRDGLAEISGRQGFRFAFIDAATTKVHLVQQVFFAIARQLDWDYLASRFVFNLFREHYRVPEDGQALTLRELARLNECEERELNIEFKNRLKKGLLQDYAMALEFRSAMAALIRYKLDPEGSGTGIDDVIKKWLKGELLYIKPLKDIGIFQKIERTNAFYLLHSLSHWLKKAGYSGLVILIDIARYLEDGRRTDGSLSYRKTAVLDCYEVLRQFIDSVDESENCLIVVAVPPLFATEAEKRSVDGYQALKMRVWDEVRDRKRANPLSPMVRLSNTQDSDMPLSESSGEVK
ncbi:MAG: DUF2791 family P-loop domain-containing protein [Dehalococcoidia bacterium]|nr:DUF2791 family P-loop domain-containing protein [Dehalococcoidia bacterium]